MLAQQFVSFESPCQTYWQYWQSVLLSIPRCDFCLQWLESNEVRILTGLLHSLIVCLSVFRLWKPKKGFDCRKPVFISIIFLPLLTSGTPCCCLVPTRGTLLMLITFYEPVFHFNCIFFTKDYHWTSINRFVRNLCCRTMFSFEVWFVSLHLRPSIDFLYI